MQTKIGRNDSCPCGSGKKFKKCCGVAKAPSVIEVSDHSWRALRKLEGSVLDGHLVPYFQEELSEEYFQEAILDFFSEDIPDQVQEEIEHFISSFFPWAVFNWVPEIDLGDELFDHEKTVAENYVNQFGDKLNSRKRKFITAMRDTYYSFYRVTDLEKDKTLTVKDSFLKTKHVLKEKKATHILSKGDYVLGRILDFEGQSIFVGMLPMLLPSNCRSSIDDFVEWVHDISGEALTGSILKEEFETDIIEHFFEMIDSMSNPRMPEIRNTDNETFQFTKSYFKLSAPCENVVQKLMPLTLEESAEDILDSADLNESGEPIKVEFPWLKRGNKQHKSWENTVMGQVSIQGDEMTLETNSAERAKRGKKLIKKYLGKSVAFINDLIETPEQKMKHMPEETPNQKMSQAELQQLPEVQAHLKSMMENHWKEWFHMSLPALDDQTPMAAAKTAEGREKLEDLLLDIEANNNRQDNPLLKADVDYLRIELEMSAAYKV